LEDRRRLVRIIVDIIWLATALVVEVAIATTTPSIVAIATLLTISDRV
jgi:hypothetical protein